MVKGPRGGIVGSVGINALLPYPLAVAERGASRGCDIEGAAPAAATLAAVNQ